MRSMSSTLEAARAGDETAFASLVAPHRRELTALCYRMSGSIHDAEDLVQDVLVRAWKGLPGFAGESSLRTWLYRITTNVCLNAIEARKARLMPSDLGPPDDGTTAMVPVFEPIWLEPCPSELYADAEPSPEARYGMRESVALAFMTALQHLNAKQRALVVLHDVLGWSAAECAELLELSSASVNSALQRARETLDKVGRRPAARSDDDAVRSLLDRYVRAWETSDLKGLVALLHEDATLAMPPIPQWLQGARALEVSMGAMVFASTTAGAFRLHPTMASGEPAFAVYRRAESGALEPYALQILQVQDGTIVGIVAFLDVRLFARFGLPATLD